MKQSKLCTVPPAAQDDKEQVLDSLSSCVEPVRLPPGVAHASVRTLTTVGML